MARQHTQQALIIQTSTRI